MYAQSGRPALPLALGNGNVSIIFITIDIDNPIFDDLRKATSCKYVYIML